MEYPIRLLPQPHFTLINFEAVSRLELVSIHHTETTDIWDENNALKAREVSFNGVTDYIHDYSVNLLGEFQINDIGWKWSKHSQCINPWHPGELVTTPACPGEVELVNNRGAFFLSIPDCYEIPFKVVTPNGIDEAICYVLHTPTCGNFWHCSLRWLAESQSGIKEDVKNWGEKERKRILKAARIFIINRASAFPPTYKAVPKSEYSGLE